MLSKLLFYVLLFVVLAVGAYWFANGSGDMVSPTRVDGFIELPRGKENFRAGELYNFMPFHPIIR